MSLFDPDSFFSEEQEELSTERVLVPAGTHEAFVASLDSKSGVAESGREWHKVVVRFEITEASVLAEMEREKVTVAKEMFLEFDETTGKLATGKGKNWELGQLRAACGKPRGPLTDIIGASVLVEVKHRVYEGKPQVEVRSVAAR